MFWIYSTPLFFLAASFHHHFSMTDLFCFQSAIARDIKHLSWQFSFFPHILSYSSRSAPSSPRSISLEMPTFDVSELHQHRSFFHYSPKRWSFPFEKSIKARNEWIFDDVVHKKNQICFWFPHFSIIEFSVDFHRWTKAGWPDRLRVRSWPFSIELFMMIFEVICDGIWRNLMET